MRIPARILVVLTAIAAPVWLFTQRTTQSSAVIVHTAVRHDLSAPLAQLEPSHSGTDPADCSPARSCGTAPEVAEDDRANPDDPDQGRAPAPIPPPYVAPVVPPKGAAVEQKAPGKRPPAELVASFDGLGVGFEGPHGAPATAQSIRQQPRRRPDHVVQIVNSRFAVLRARHGKVITAPCPPTRIFKGFGGLCERATTATPSSATTSSPAAGSS